MNSDRQFRVLYRQFLFRLLDIELLSGSARGDADELLGQFGALLIFGSVLLSLLAVPIGDEVRRSGSPGPLWSAERFIISLTMLVVGVFALLSWDSTFPDRRDVLVLSPLPVRGHTLFAAKIAAAGSGLGLTAVAWNSLAGFAWPMALAPEGTGFFGTARYMGAFWFALLAAATFLYCAILGIQALAAQLPRRWYLRVSSTLQIGLFALFLLVLFFQPPLNTAAALAAPENQRTIAWLPPYWFMALLNQMSGIFPAEEHAVMAPLAARAVASLAIAILAAGGAFLLSYMRTLRKIAEGADILPGSRSGIWLPRFSGSPRTALVQFAIRTLLRSRQHRVILAFYLGGGFAIAIVYLQGALDMVHLTWTELIRQPNPFVLAASLMMLSAAWLGVRTVFSLPLDLRANWLFRATPPHANAIYHSAARTALLTATVFPTLAAFALLSLWFWSWSMVAEHLALLGLAGSILVDLSLLRFRKIPFTCSYLPGKTKAHMVFWFGIIPLVTLIHKGGQLEFRLMANQSSYWLVLGAFAAIASVTRAISKANVKRETQEIRFEDSRSDEMIGLGLSN